MNFCRLNCTTKSWHLLNMQDKALDRPGLYFPNPYGDSKNGYHVLKEICSHHFSLCFMSIECDKVPLVCTERVWSVVCGIVSTLKSTAVKYMYQYERMTQKFALWSRGVNALMLNHTTMIPNNGYLVGDQRCFFFLNWSNFWLLGKRFSLQKMRLLLFFAYLTC